MGKKGSYSKGMEGIIATESSICKIDGQKGTLQYRGYSIEDLAANATFEEVTYLLWHNKLPNKKELASFRKKLNQNMILTPLIKKFLESLPKNLGAMTSLRGAIDILANHDPDLRNFTPEGNLRKATRILAVMPVLVAAIGRIKDRKKLLKPKKNLGFAGNFLYMLTGKTPSKEAERTMEVCLILHAEHGMNASTFAGRVAASTLSDIHSGMVSALATLKGPLHGGANKRAIQALHTMGKEIQVKNVCDADCQEQVEHNVKKSLEKKERIMGIGHRVYKVKDPRAIILEKYASIVKSEDYKYYQMAKRIERTMAEEKGLYPNVDFFSGIVYSSLGIKEHSYVCIFALARTSGWLAHMMEQYSNNRLIRPKALYVGDLNKKFVDIQKRK